VEPVRTLRATLERLYADEAYLRQMSELARVRSAAYAAARRDGLMRTLRALLAEEADEAGSAQIMV
jgi:hypothetical protein